MWRKEAIPQEFKDATIIHLFKLKGNPQVCDNQVISLLSIAGKILASVILNRVDKHIEQSGLICCLFYEAICFMSYLLLFCSCVFQSFSIAITLLGEERANLSAFRTFVRLELVWFCLSPLPPGVWEWLRFVIVALPGRFSYLFFLPESQCGFRKDRGTIDLHSKTASREILGTEYGPLHDLYGHYQSI